MNDNKDLNNVIAPETTNETTTPEAEKPLTLKRQVVRVLRVQAGVRTGCRCRALSQP